MYACTLAASATVAQEVRFCLSNSRDTAFNARLVRDAHIPSSGLNTGAAVVVALLVVVERHSVMSHCKGGIAFG